MTYWEEKINAHGSIISKNTRHGNSDQPHENTVKKYARDMRNGNFEENGEPIIFNTKGELTNGQHRLTAIVRSGVTLEMVVVTADGNKHDLNSRRKVYQIGRMEGYGELMTPKNTSIARYLLECSGRSNPTETEIIQEIKNNENVFEWFFKSMMYNTGNAKRPLIRVPVCAAVMSAYKSGYPMFKLDRFCEVLIDGIPSQTADYTILPLRDYLLTHPARGRKENKDIYMRTQNALYNYESGKVVNRCQAAVNEKYKWGKLTKEG